MNTGQGWSVEAEPEVVEWASSLPLSQFARVAFHIDLLEREGALLGEPYARQLRGKLRELRFHIEESEWRVSYFIGSGRRIVLLTVFRKTQPRERREIERAWKAMTRCLDEGHLEQEAE